jgi:hypothetical protein
MTTYRWAAWVAVASLPGHAVMLCFRSNCFANTMDPCIVEVIYGLVVWTLVGLLTARYVRSSRDERVVLMRASLCPLLAIAIWALLVVSSPKSLELSQLTDYARLSVLCSGWRDDYPHPRVRHPTSHRAPPPSR